MTQEKDQPVLILGATSDIAKALAHEFARHGHPLQLASRNISDLERCKTDLEVRYKAVVTLHRFDILDITTHHQFFSALQPKPYYVICAVGLLGNQAEQEQDVQQAELVMRTNYMGPAIALEAAAQTLIQNSGATAIIGISSVAGDRGRAKNYYYGSAKAGFTQFLSGLRQKLSKTKVHVMTVKPGFVATRMTEGMVTPKSLTMQPEELATLVFQSLKKKRHVVYDWKWQIIMSIIKMIPEKIFKKLRF
ncbi:MAG: SDR family oxidoreductase [Proteobacteria bacterium]|nr:SDR family oxidoreductase [Pseudomonadota bacterium]